MSLHTIASRGREIMNDIQVPRKLRYILWREAFQTATQLDGLTIIEIDGIKNTRYVHWDGSNPVFTKNLRTWGKAGVAKLFNKRSPKIFERGFTCMFVGYPNNHASDTYCMWDPRSTQVHVTRDVTWLKKMYFPKIHTEVDTLVEYVQHENTKLPNGNDNKGDDDDKLNDNNDVTEIDDNQSYSNEDKEEGIVSDEAVIPKVDTKKSKLLGQVDREISRVFLLTKSRQNDALLIGAGLGEGISNTFELQVKKYKQAMASQD